MSSVNKHRVLTVLSAIIMAMLIAPVFQQWFYFIKEKPLTGAFYVHEKPSVDSLSFRSWFNGQFQQQFNTNLEANIGFRSSLVRLNNQLQYSLFSKANAEGVIVGKDNELFEEDYIRAAMGEYFVGESVWQTKAVQLKAIQDTLDKLGKKLIVVFEPGKGSVYSDKYPTKYDFNNRSASNYDVFKRKLDTLQVNVLDLNACFMLWKNHRPYRLFPRTGTHWSYYGAALAADTTLRYLRTFFGPRIPQMRIERLIEKTEPRHPDDDIWLAMNLLNSTPYNQLAYPVVQFEPSNQQKINALLVGDSFFFNWQSDGIVANAFDEGNFWYYNKHAWNFAGSETGLVANLNFKEEILKRDLIMIMITERFHHNFAWRFDEQLFQLFYPTQKKPYDIFANDIRVSNEEFLRLAKDATRTGMSLQDRLKKEAQYLMYLDYLQVPEKYTDKDDRMLMLMMSIKGTKEWYEKIIVKANERNIPVEEMLRMDAEWLYNEKYGK